MKILVVEDDFASRKLVLACLARVGSCDGAVNGVEALEAFRTAHEQGAPYDLICLDIMMPVLDGQQALQLIREEEERRGIPRAGRVKIIMITALDDMKQIMASYHSLCDDYLMKPIDRDKLLEAVRKVGFSVDHLI